MDTQQASSDEIYQMWVSWQNTVEAVSMQYGYGQIERVRDIRYGQRLYNELNSISSSIAHLCLGTHWDPFHNSAKVPEFLERVNEIFEREIRSAERREKKEQQS